MNDSTSTPIRQKHTAATPRVPSTRTTGLEAPISQNGETIPLFIDAARAQLAQNALIEILGWTDLLEREINHSDLTQVSSTIVRRLGKLGNFVLACVGDRYETTSSLAARFAEEVNA